MAASSGDIKAIVAFEPGAFIFPEGNRPDDIPSPVLLVNQRMEPPHG